MLATRTCRDWRGMKHPAHTLRHNSRLHHIGLGARLADTPVSLLIDDLHIRVMQRHTGELIRELILDPTRDYQPRGLPPANGVPTHHRVEPRVTGQGDWPRVSGQGDSNPLTPCLRSGRAGLVDRHSRTWIAFDGVHIIFLFE